MPSIEDSTKSTLQRVVIETSVQYKKRCGESLSNLSSDLSVGGIYLKTKDFLSRDETITLTFSLPTKDQEFAVTCQARVAWTNYEHNRLKLDYPPGAGLEFLDLSSEVSSKISNFIDLYDDHKKMDMICAWCGKHLGLRKGPHGTSSHGICGQCREQHFSSPTSA